ncbi:acyltransferase [Furfurilactobacillus siliginis]|uniref:Membrane protein n=2 Tax=Furfurilactobacillus siliginis TaxID=348151 RepID=A0A510VMY9_9LACO|nr:acyltransferase [Furfurilactobacillus siliginis]GEK28292.1 membrane protein [Furfurilactobacillus siliginis]
MAQSKRLSFMDFSAIISSFAVVTLHSAAGNFSFTNPSPSATLTIIIQIIFSFGVPMFFMQSGANVLNYRERYSTTTFFKKRLTKVVIPFLCWSVIAYVFLVLKTPTINWSIIDFLYRLVTDTILGPYWFFYNIIAFYLCVPFLSVLLNHLKHTQILYLLALSTAVNAVYLPFMRAINSPTLDYVNLFPAIGNYLEYFLIGWYIVHVGVSAKWKKRIYILSILSLVYELTATIISTYHYGYIVKPYYDISNLPAVIIMAALFLLLKENNNNFSKYELRLKFFSGLTFGIYLIHPYVIALLDKLLKVNSATIHILIFPILVYVISGLVVFLLHKIPYIKHVLP